MPLLLALALMAQQPDTTRLPEVVVTASRIPTASATTYATTVLTHAQLVEQGHVQLLDALRQVPGLTVVQAGSRGAQASIFLRGGESDFVKFLIDGVAVNSPGGWFNVANLSTANIDRIEIVRGPGSVLHGADAMAGTIQVFTRQGAGTLRPSAHVEGGGQQSRLLSTGLHGAGSAGTVSLEASRFRTDGSYPYNSGYRHDELSGRLALPGAGPWQAAVTFRAAGSRAEFPTDGTGALADNNQYTTEDQVVAGLDVRRQLRGTVSLQVVASLGRTEEGLRDAMDGAADTLGYGFEARSDSRGVRSGMDVRLLGLRAGALEAVLGVQYEDERQRRTASATSNFGFGAATDRQAFRVTRSTRAAYGEAAVQVRPSVVVSTAARLDDNSAFGTHGSWRLGLAARVRSTVVLHAQAGRAFKAPTFSELFARSPFEVGNPALDPETSTGVDLGIRAALLGGRAHLGASGFSQRFANLVQYASAAPGAPTYSNVGLATSKGVELSGDLQVTGTVGLTASATRLSTRVVRNGGSGAAALAEGASLIRRPDWSGAAALRWAPAAGSSIRLGTEFLGARDDVDFRSFPATRVRLRGRAITELAATTGLPGTGGLASVTVRVENLFATRWEQVVGFPGRGRLVHVGVRSTR